MFAKLSTNEELETETAVEVAYKVLLLARFNLNEQFEIDSSPVSKTEIALPADARGLVIAELF